MKRILSIITGLLILITLVMIYRFISTVIFDEGLFYSIEFYQVFWFSQLIAIFISLVFGYFIALKFFGIKKFTYGKAILIIISISLFAAGIVFLHILVKQRNLGAYADFIPIIDQFEHNTYELYWKRILGPSQLVTSIGTVIFSYLVARKKGIIIKAENGILDD